MTKEDLTFTISKTMYRRPKFLEILLEIREEMSREADYDVDLFAETVRSGAAPKRKKLYDLSKTDSLPSKTEIVTEFDM